MPERSKLDRPWKFLPNPRQEVAELAKAVDAVVGLTNEKLRAARSRAWLPFLRFALEGVRADCQQGLEELNAGDAVDHAVVHLDDQGKAVVLDALDHPEFPKWTASIEMLRKESTHQPFERTLIAGQRQARVAQMKVHVETVVINPDRVPIPRDPLDTLPVARNRVHRRLGVSGEAFDIETSVLERERLRIENQSGAHMHRSGLALDVEERRVQSAQSLVECFRHSVERTSKM